MLSEKNERVSGSERCGYAKSNASLDIGSRMISVPFLALRLGKTFWSSAKIGSYFKKTIFLFLITDF